MKKVKKKAWTDGKTKKQIAQVIAKRKLTRETNRLNRLEEIDAKTKNARKARQTKQSVGTGTVIFEENKNYIVGVRFRAGDGAFNSDTYHYATDIAGIQIGDLVAVTARGMIKLAEVVTLGNKTSYKGPLQWVVDKIDMVAHNNREVLRQRKEALAQKLVMMKRQIDETTVLELYAAKNPEFKAVLEEYNSL